MHKNVRLLALFNFFTDFHLFSAILVLYFAHISGSYILAMSLYSITMVSSALFEIPTGIFSDFIGRKKTLILGALFSLLSHTFYAIGINYTILLIGALFEGMQRAWYSGNNDALLYESMAENNQQHEYETYLGKTSAMFQVATALGVVIGAFLANWSFAIVMWLSVIPQIICFIIALFVVEPKRKTTQTTNVYKHLTSSAFKLWNNKKLRLLSITNIVGYAIGESSYQFRSAFVNTLWPIWAVGIASMLSSIGAAISYWFSGKLIKRFKALTILLVDNIYSKIINLIFLSFPSMVSPLFMTSTSLFFGVSEVASSTLMQQEFSDNERATLGSISSFAGSIMFGVFAILLGYMADHIGPAKALLVAYTLSLPTVYLYYKLFRHHQPSKS
jgi:MFS family permease